MKLSIIIPAYNEEKRIAASLEDYATLFSEKYGKDFEIIVVMNGCKDNTFGIVNNFEKIFPQIKHLDFEKSGKGFAIIEGFKVAKGELVGFTDADNSTDASQFEKLIENLKDYDGIIGSRWMKGSVVEPRQPFSRRIASRSFNLLTRMFFGLKFGDTQCGAKIFKKEAISRTLPRLGITEWAFDIDLLYKLKKNGCRIKEIPITWRDVGGSKLNVSKTSLKMFLAVTRLRLINSPFRFVVKTYDCMPEWLKIHHRLK